MHVRTPEFYLATVCLERNRWGTRRPSLHVSDWCARIRADGFDGVELWENHFMAADAEEQTRLANAAPPLAVFNAYVQFSPEQAERRAEVAVAVRRLRARAVKYNLSREATGFEDERKRVLEWAEQLPADCRLLCECHSGTPLEEPEAAMAYFADLDPQRHGAIAHLAGDPEDLERWFGVLGERIVHLHVQLRPPESDPELPAGRQALEQCCEVARSHEFRGSVAIEFTRGIGGNEDSEQIYRNACSDMNHCRRMFS